MNVIGGVLVGLLTAGSGKAVVLSVYRTIEEPKALFHAAGGSLAAFMASKTACYC